MCATCGCGTTEGHVHEHSDGAGHEHDHEHEHEHEHDHVHVHGHEGDYRLITLEQDVLAKNDRVAARNRALFGARRIAAFNFTSAPGAGKTTLLEALIKQIGGRFPLAVIEGDQETARDADRIRSTGAPVVQINTRTGCHLDAQMVNAAVTALDPPRGALLLIENVGNLVCPALFDLGERAKAVILACGAAGRLGLPAIPEGPFGQAVLDEHFARPIRDALDLGELEPAADGGVVPAAAGGELPVEREDREHHARDAAARMIRERAAVGVRITAAGSEGPGRRDGSARAWKSALSRPRSARRPSTPARG